MKGWFRVGVVFLLSVYLAACTSGSSRSNDDGKGQRMRVEGAMPITIEEAAKFAGFPLPGPTEPIGSHQISGIDRLVAFAVRIPPQSVHPVLRDAGFSGELRTGRRAFQSPVDGVDLDRAKSFAAGQDEREVNGTKVVREIMLVTDDPNVTVMNVWAFG